MIMLVAVSVPGVLQAAAAKLWHAEGGVQGLRRNEATNVSDWTLSTLASLDLPKGSFFLTAKATLQDPNVSASTVYCFLKGPGGSNLDTSVGYSVQDEPVTLPLQATVTLQQADAVTLACGITTRPDPFGDGTLAQAFAAKLAAMEAKLE